MSQNELLKQISAYAFAEKEWNLYLDTHPTDKDALAKHKAMAEKTKELVKEYEQNFGPLTSMSALNQNCFDWITEPWPWEQCN